MFDYIGVCPYDKSIRSGKIPRGRGRKALSRLGNFFEYWFLHLRRLFHMLIGLAFMGFTVMGASVTLTEWQDYRKDPELGLARFDIMGGFTVVLAICCLYSFVKARNVR
jgi:hypothetical protein